MRNSYVDDDWDGFDHNSSVYDAKKEKSYHARIWWCLAIIGVGIVLSLINRQCKDYKMSKTYKCIRGEVYGKPEDCNVTYIMENGKSRIIHIPPHPVKKEGDYILLYYLEDSAYAKTIPSFKNWLPYYLFFIGLSGLSLFKLYNIYIKDKQVENI